jgi:hypothetical protein
VLYYNSNVIFVFNKVYNEKKRDLLALNETKKNDLIAQFGKLKIDEIRDSLMLKKKKREQNSVNNLKLTIN